MVIESSSLKNNNPMARVFFLFQRYFLFTIALLLISCEPDTVDITLGIGNRGDLIRFEKVGSMAVQDVINKAAEQGDVTSVALHDIELYKVIYNTVHEGQIVEASGLVILPIGVSVPVDLVQYHHGTVLPILQEGSIPSFYTGENFGNLENYLVGPTIASSGFIVAMPDYVGYGHSSGEDHPYNLYESHLGEYAVDMLRATGQLISSLNIDYSFKVHLAGWSEGAGVGLSCLKLLQEKYSGEFDVQSSSFLAGAYDFDRFVLRILNNPDRSYFGALVYSWTLYSINKYILDPQRDANEIWKYEVANQEQSYSVPSNTISNIFQPFLIDNITNGNDKAMLDYIKQNDLIDDWTPLAPINFHYGEDDNLVFPFNSINAFNAFKDAGASVDLTPHTGDHFDPVFDYTLQTIEYFK